MFVDDELNVLQGLQRMLRSKRHEWQMAFVNSGAEALQLLEKEPVDVVVSDMRMPGMDGAELLTAVMDRYPDTVRILLSGHSDHEAILRSIRPTHQFLSKPCDPEVLQATIERVCTLKAMLTSEAIRKVVSRMESLPSLPHVYTEMMGALKDPTVSLTEIGNIVTKDSAMTAKLLQLVNSAFFGIPQEVSSPAQAISLLGLETVKTLVLSFHLFSSFGSGESAPIDMDTQWRHSMSVAKMAKTIMSLETQERHIQETAFTAGMLHDLGTLILANQFPAEFKMLLQVARDKRIPIYEAEKNVFGVSHPEVGAYLLGLWGLPGQIVEAVAFHHCPSLLNGHAVDIVLAVHVADFYERQTHPETPDAVASCLDMENLRRLGLASRLSVWQQMCYCAQERGF